MIYDLIEENYKIQGLQSDNLCQWKINPVDTTKP